MIEHVVLVNENDEEIGLMEKIKAHQLGMLHRAFSIFIFNSQNELLLQQRSSNKYHSSNLWTNTCCSHPRHNEPIKDAAKRRLKEEMNLECDLKFLTKFVYKADLDNHLIEHELDYIFRGHTDTLPLLNKNEAQAYRYISFQNLQKEIQNTPEQFTEWFKICFINYPSIFF